MVEVFRFVYYNLIRTGSYLKATAKLSEEEVAETARKYAESIGYVCNNNLTQQRPQLTHTKEKFIWDVFFSPSDNGIPFIGGGHLRLLTDDETGEVVKQFVGTR